MKYYPTMEAQQRLYRAYWAVERLIVPNLRGAQDVYVDLLKERVGPGISWLDVGCGHQLLPPWRLNVEKDLCQQAGMVVGMDQDFGSLRKHKSIQDRVTGNASRLPFRERTFDLVTANMVVEHLDQPAQQFQEIHRVLKPGGTFIFHTPNAAGYLTILARATPEFLKPMLIRLLEARKREDVFPTYYRANTRSAVVSLARKAGFYPQELQFCSSSATSAFVLPLAVLELLWIRLLMRPRLASLRPSMIVTLQKAKAASVSAGG